MLATACGCLKEGARALGTLNARPMKQHTTKAIRSYRIYFRDGLNTLSPAHEVDLGSDEEARQLAEMMLSDRPECSCAEIWDRARLVETLQRGGSLEPQ
jgi:hypothetical protein